MDSIFGVENFKNEIIWKRQTAHSDARRRFGRVGDRILFYSKTPNYKFNRLGTELKKSQIRSKYIYPDENGRKFSLGDLNPPHGRGPVYEFHGITRPWRFTKEKMLQLEREGRIYTEWKVPRIKRYLDESKIKEGAVIQEIWDDIYPINSQAKERLGYPTQKPLALLERIIKTCSNEGDLILDPFCGCGTAVAAAEKLHRKWIGIDITYLAINLVKGRFSEMFIYTKVGEQGKPEDIEGAIALSKDRYQFQWWALSLINARPVGSTYANPDEGKKGADQGYDGWLRFGDGSEGHTERILVQVKSGNVGVQLLRDFRDVVITGQKAAIGIFITLRNPTLDMIKLVRGTDPYISPRWNHEYPRVQILTIGDLLDPKGKRPDIPPTMSSYTKAEFTSRTNDYYNKKLFE